VLAKNLQGPYFTDEKILSFLKDRDIKTSELNFCNFKIFLSKTQLITPNGCRSRWRVTLFFYKENVLLGSISYCLKYDLKNNFKIYEKYSYFMAPFDNEAGFLSDSEVLESLFNNKELSEWLIWNRIL